MNFLVGFCLILWTSVARGHSNSNPYNSKIEDLQGLAENLSQNLSSKSTLKFEIFLNETQYNSSDTESILENENAYINSRNGTECPQVCFCELEESYVSCIGEGTSSIPTLPAPITRVELQGFYIVELNTSSIHLPGVIELKIQQCNLTRLQPGAFLKMSTLDRLDLSKNLLTKLAKNLFSNLTQLKHLDLSSNLLTSLSYPFIPLQSLEQLNLENNKLVRLNSDTFLGLNKAQYINLGNNYIKTIDVAAFQHMTSLAHLILSNNPLSKLSRLNFFGSRLQSIDVSNIGVEKVPQVLTQFVKDLRLNNNTIREIHRGDLDSYPYIGLLVLDYNGLVSLEEDALGRHEFLTRLWLNGNKLKTIPQSLPPSLKALYLERNLIDHLNCSDFSGLTRLEKISLKSNRLNYICTNAFRDSVALKTVDLRSNNLSSISQSTFKQLVKLETLDLSGNPITVLNALAFDGLSRLNVLRLSRIHTQIRISDRIFEPLNSLRILEIFESPHLAQIVTNSSRLLYSLRELRDLNLMHNRLKFLKNNFFAFLPQLETIKLGGNLWNCTDAKNALYLKHWMTNTPINFFRSFTVR